MMEWIKKNDIGPKAAALLMAFLLWLFLVSGRDVNMSKTFSRVPVDLRGVDSLTANNLILTGGSQSTVSFRVTGSSDRIAMLSDNDGLTVTADLSGITEPGEYDLKYQVTASTSEVTISKITASVPVVVDRLISKSVPVDLELSGTLQSGYVSDGYSLDPDAVTVTGPAQVLDTIVSAAADFDISDVRASTQTTLSYTLVDASGEEVKSSLLRVDTPSVRLTYIVRQRGEIPLIINATPYGFINSDLVDITLEPATIRVSGLPDVVSTLNQIDLGTLSLEQVFENEQYVYTRPLVLPNGVTSDDAVTTVRVTVTPKDVVKANIELTRDLLPQSEDFTYASDLIVSVWTTADSARSLSSGDVDVTLSYRSEELTPGLNEIPVKVTPLNNQMILIGDYTIVVEVPEE
ncbi:MAG: hypothetical protein E7423_04545 [Ruminococcaceae bacterium]|jgi:YbbR domain-containing protein|nr:hypothetical protein [Oscillospiraceae bacterium]